MFLKELPIKLMVYFAMLLQPEEHSLIRPIMYFAHACCYFDFGWTLAEQSIKEHDFILTFIVLEYIKHLVDELKISEKVYRPSLNITWNVYTKKMWANKLLQVFAITPMQRVQSKALYYTQTRWTETHPLDHFAHPLKALLPKWAKALTWRLPNHNIWCGDVINNAYQSICIQGQFCYFFKKITFHETWWIQMCGFVTKMGWNSSRGTWHVKKISRGASRERRRTGLLVNHYF